MKKDILIDTNQIQYFTNPAEGEYRDLMQWLLENNQNEDQEDNAYLVLSKSLVMEYHRTLGEATKMQPNIHIIMKKMREEGRTVSIKEKDIEEFRRVHFTAKVLKKLQSNSEDHDHIAAVLLSDRKMTLTSDQNFTIDLTRMGATAAELPSKLNYK